LLARILFGLLLAVLTAAPAWAQKSGEPPTAPAGFSSWDVQALYGSGFQEPENPHDVAKAILTFENSSGWSWGSSYFFVDVIRSDAHDSHASEVYSEWYPSASLSALTGKNLSVGILRNVSVTMGLNAGTKNTGADPLVYLPGLTFDFNLPGFAFFSIGTYAYIDDGRFSGLENGCHATTYQITPSWSLPFALGKAKFSFDGFVDFIGDHGQCVSQILSQSQLKIEVASFGSKPDTLYAGIEWQYWDHKFGIEGLNESFPQLLLVWKF
jgi:nucleoside-specific outer membrane channel protein Tsx